MDGLSSRAPRPGPEAGAPLHALERPPELRGTKLLGPGPVVKYLGTRDGGDYTAPRSQSSRTSVVGEESPAPALGHGGRAGRFLKRPSFYEDGP